MDAKVIIGCPENLDEEGSDIRAHVTLPGRQVVVFRPADARRLLDTGIYEVKTATQPGVNGRVTGVGHVIPIADIEPIYILQLDVCPWNRWNYNEMDTVDPSQA